MSGVGPGRGNGAGPGGEGRVGPGHPLRIVIGAVLALALVLATGALTRYQHTATAHRAELRLAWRLAVPQVQECRPLTAEEQADLPAHMRRDEVCETESVRYRLEVRIDDELRHRATVAPEGARGDRPMQVFEELRLEPGDRHVQVVFERADTTDAASSGETEAGETQADETQADNTEAGVPEAGEPPVSRVPERLVFDRRLELDDREVVLVTYDPDERELVRRTGDAR